MAQSDEPTKSADKGKEKATDKDQVKSDEGKKDKDGKPIVNGKKEETVEGGRFSSWGILELLLADLDPV